jgi:hypothetical protein
MSLSVEKEDAIERHSHPIFLFGASATPFVGGEQSDGGRPAGCDNSPARDEASSQARETPIVNCTIILPLPLVELL